ncbi:MAG: HAD family phosphatase [Bryobacteraceae bacterium]
MLRSNLTDGKRILAPGMAILFDMDGVIIHSTPLHNRAWEIYLGRHGIDPGEIEHRMHGKRNDEIVLDYFGPGLTAAEVFEHGAAKERLYRELMAPELERWLVPGIRQILAACEGVPKAVASNAERPNIDFVLDGAGIRHYFRAAVDGGQVEKPKPAPEVFLKAAAQLGVDPGDCVVFEDSRAGVEAARRAGMRVMGLTTTLPSLADADLNVADFTDPRVAEWLASLQPLGR